jgi:hypothetical protein
MSMFGTKTYEVSEGKGSNTGSGSSSGILAVAPEHHYNKKRSAVNMTDMTDTTDDVSRSKLARMGHQRKDAWALLLAERPNTDQSDEMSAWLMKVMAVSDLTKPAAQALAKLKAGAPKSSNEDSNESSPTDE